MKYYEVAAKWWSGKVSQIRTTNYISEDNSPVAAIAMIQAYSLAMKISSYPRNVENFEERLAEVIKEKVEADKVLILSTTYVPDSILEEISKETGIPSIRFPWNITMKITESQITVSVCNKKEQTIHLDESKIKG